MAHKNKTRQKQNSDNPTMTSFQHHHNDHGGGQRRGMCILFVLFLMNNSVVVHSFVTKTAMFLPIASFRIKANGVGGRNFPRSQHHKARSTFDISRITMGTHEYGQQQQERDFLVSRVWTSFGTVVRINKKKKVTNRRSHRPDQQPTIFPSYSFSSSTSLAAIGLVGNFGLIVLSILLVRLIYARFILPPKDATNIEAEQPAGILLNRCPWPFIVFHDPKQFFQDSPTWMIVTYVALRKLLKMIFIATPQGI